MSGKALKHTAFLFLLAGLVGLGGHAFRTLHEAVATERAPGFTFQGGSGDTPATAVMIAGTSDYVAVVAGEYQYLGKQFGKQGQAWEVVKKEEYQHADRVYDIITVRFASGTVRQIFFDITKYFKKP
jgi:hypothetical protein